MEWTSSGDCMKAKFKVAATNPNSIKHIQIKINKYETPGLVDPQKSRGGVRIVNLPLATLVEITNTAYLCKPRKGKE